MLRFAIVPFLTAQFQPLAVRLRRFFDLDAICWRRIFSCVPVPPGVSFAKHGLVKGPPPAAKPFWAQSALTSTHRCPFQPPAQGHLWPIAIERVFPPRSVASRRAGGTRWQTEPPGARRGRSA